MRAGLLRPTSGQVHIAAYVRAVRDLTADGNKGWHEDRNVDIIVKHTNAKREVIKKARPLNASWGT